MKRLTFALAVLSLFAIPGALNAQATYCEFCQEDNSTGIQIFTCGTALTSTLCDPEGIHLIECELCQSGGSEEEQQVRRSTALPVLSVFGRRALPGIVLEEVVGCEGTVDIRFEPSTSMTLLKATDTQ